MPDYRGLRPRILWGTSTGVADAWDFGYPLDQANAYSLDREGSEQVQLVSGVEDASQAGQDYYLEGVARWIPPEDTLASGSVRRATGWNGTSGVDAARHWMRGKRVVRVCPDNRNLVLTPVAATDTNSDGVADDWSAVGTGGGIVRSIVSGQRIVVTTVATGYYYVRQRIPGLLATETVALGVDMTTSGLSGATGFAEVQALDSGGSVLSATHYQEGTSGRLTQSAATLPTGTVAVYLNIGVRVTAGTGSGTVTFTNASLRRDGSTAYTANPDVRAYFVPGEPPTLERSNAHRALALRFRSTSAFEGF